MIIVCSGCSFTHGAELWEEKHIPFYVQANNLDEGAKIATTFFDKFNDFKGMYGDIETQARELSYSGSIKSLTGHKVINIGKGGASQQEISQKTLTTLTRLKKDNPDEKIVCIMQDTSPDRIWIKDRDPKRVLHGPINGLKSYVLPLLDRYYYDKLEAYEIKDAYMKYSTIEQMHMDYYLQSAMVQNFCLNNDIKFLHFIMWDNQHKIDNPKLDMSFIYDMFFDDRYCIPVAMVYKLEDHYGNKKFYLPGLHVNCDSHKLIGKWLVKEMQDRNII